MNLFRPLKTYYNGIFEDTGRLLGTFKGGEGRVTHSFKSPRSPYIFCGKTLKLFRLLSTWSAKTLIIPII